MPIWSDGLAGTHKEIAEDPGRSIHVLAGPGTGKTFAMMRRVARLLEEGVDPGNILVVTFTRTAANDLSEGLQGLGIEAASEVRASTLHSLCFSILGTTGAFAFTQRKPRPLLSYETECLVSDLAISFNGKRNTGKLARSYEAAWARLQPMTPGFATTNEEKRFELELIEWLRFHEAMLIGELVPLTLKFVLSNPALGGIPSFDHVLVDEYQDLNRADQELLRLLSNGKSYMVIGDDNQSIYAFLRHANPEGIRRFPEENPGTKEYRITESRRCPPNIVAMSNALISHDPRTTRKAPLVTNEGIAAAEVWVVQQETVQDEIDNIADFVDDYLNRHPDVNPGRVLILATRRFIGNAIRNALVSKNRHAMSFFNEDPVASREAAEGFCLLNLLVDEKDVSAIRAWFGICSDDCCAKPIRWLRDYCKANQAGLFETLEHMGNGTLKITYTSSLVPRWQLLRERLSSMKDLSVRDLVGALWPQGNPGTEDIRALAMSVAENAQTPSELFMSLKELITQPEIPGPESGIIQVMSLQKSKGLTRDLVVIAGCMAGVLPLVDERLHQAEQRAQLEEQRRLFYVAATRATRALVISAAALLPTDLAYRSQINVVKKVWHSGKSHAVMAFSPFIGELGGSAPAPIRGRQWRIQAGF